MVVAGVRRTRDEPRDGEVLGNGMPAEKSEVDSIVIAAQLDYYEFRRVYTSSTACHLDICVLLPPVSNSAPLRAHSPTGFHVDETGTRQIESDGDASVLEHRQASPE